MEKCEWNDCEFGFMVRLNEDGEETANGKDRCVG